MKRNPAPSGQETDGRGALPVTGLVLAGGESSRMSTPKAFLKVRGVPIIERELRALGPLFSEVIIVANEPGRFMELGCRVVPDSDRFPGARGPLLGVYSGLSAAKDDFAFVVACDMPFIEPALVRWLAGLRAGHDAVVPKVGGLFEPLFALYGKTALGAMEGVLARGGGTLRDTFAGLDVRYADEDEIAEFDPGLRSFINVNTPEDLTRAEKSAGAVRRRKCSVGE